MTATAPKADLADVQKVVASKNAEARKDIEAFQHDGWTIRHDVAPPDHRLTTFDPSLLAEGREADLRLQLASTLPLPGDAARVAEIARNAKDPLTRLAAVEALGRVATEESAGLLADLLAGDDLDKADPARGHAAALLHPRDLDDPVAVRMAGLLDSRALTPGEKQQIAFTLALVSLRDGMTLPESVTRDLSAEAVALIDSMRSLAQRRFVADQH